MVSLLLTLVPAILSNASTVGLGLKFVSVRTFILVRQICVAATIDVGVSTDFVKRNSVMCKIS